MSYSRSSEPVKFERDCGAVMVPQGEEVILPAGTTGYITQALGGSFTVFVDGNLFRIAGDDADAIGKVAPPPLELPEGAGDAEEVRGISARPGNRMIGDAEPGRTAGAAHGEREDRRAGVEAFIRQRVVKMLSPIDGQ